MRSRADDIRKRIARRKRERDKLTEHNPVHPLWAEDEERYGFEKISSFESGRGDGEHPLFRKEFFLFKILASACLVLMMAIIFRSEAGSLEPVRSFVKKSMNDDFQFAAVSEWYEQQFGKPLALLPFKEDSGKDKTEKLDSEYALPASGKILEDFDVNGQGVMIETGVGAAVQAMNEGFVNFAGEKEGFGKTVIIQHGDTSQSWYANLEEIDVELYDFIEKGSTVGTVSQGTDGSKGVFYFAIKKGDNFVDPVPVIRFE
ncbi:peptidase M23 [Bacillus canaveralius]|uniref:Peptidase M23 n=1 Tax=Bacillus canaveralius TaxID=1403243 RepID=A0A2N5GFM1_9BACI|nr:MULTISPECIES: M23 family metallopeptidase [Bacillus]PLR79547.1 peptidase M23 [Bacillus canaveralius]PLR86273.1 peptidase M23 [Bacillus sp. V33-4]PLR89796.1 peptidase M23 [Bacillus canaveralius]RSK52430.1 M23 family metallopeptidase [Bacillus canaveralius]